MADSEQNAHEEGHLLAPAAVNISAVVKCSDGPLDAGASPLLNRKEEGRKEGNAGVRNGQVALAQGVGESTVSIATFGGFHSGFFSPSPRRPATSEVETVPILVGLGPFAKYRIVVGNGAESSKTATTAEKGQVPEGIMHNNIATNKDKRRASGDHHNDGDTNLSPQRSVTAPNNSSVGNNNNNNNGGTSSAMLRNQLFGGFSEKARSYLAMGFYNGASFVAQKSNDLIAWVAALALGTNPLMAIVVLEAAVITTLASEYISTRRIVASRSFGGGGGEGGSSGIIEFSKVYEAVLSGDDDKLEEIPLPSSEAEFEAVEKRSIGASVSRDEVLLWYLIAVLLYKDYRPPVNGYLRMYFKLNQAVVSSPSGRRGASRERRGSKGMDRLRRAASKVSLVSGKSRGAATEKDCGTEGAAGRGRKKRGEGGSDATDTNKKAPSVSKTVSTRGPATRTEVEDLLMSQCSEEQMLVVQAYVSLSLRRYRSAIEAASAVLALDPEDCSMRYVRCVSSLFVSDRRTAGEDSALLTRLQSPFVCAVGLSLATYAIPSESARSVFKEGVGAELDEAEELYVYCLGEWAHGLTLAHLADFEAARRVVEEPLGLLDKCRLKTWLLEVELCANIALKDAKAIVEASTLAPLRELHLALLQCFGGGFDASSFAQIEVDSAVGRLLNPPSPLSQYVDARAAVAYYFFKARSLYGFGFLRDAWVAVLTCVAAAEELLGTTEFCFSDCAPHRALLFAVTVGVAYADQISSDATERMFDYRERVRARRQSELDGSEGQWKANETDNTTDNDGGGRGLRRKRRGGGAADEKDQLTALEVEEEANYQRLQAEDAALTNEILRLCAVWSKKIRYYYPNMVRGYCVVVQVAIASGEERSLEHAWIISDAFPESILAQNLVPYALFSKNLIDDAAAMARRSLHRFPHVREVRSMYRAISEQDGSYSHAYRSIVPITFVSGSTRPYRARTLAMFGLVLFHFALLILIVVMAEFTSIFSVNVGTSKEIAGTPFLDSYVPPVVGGVWFLYAFFGAVFNRSLVSMAFADLHLRDTVPQRLLFMTRGVGYVNLATAVYLWTIGRLESFTDLWSGLPIVIVAALCVLAWPLSTRVFFLRSVDEPLAGFTSWLSMLVLDVVTFICLIPLHVALVVMEPISFGLFFFFMPAIEEQSSGDVKERLVAHALRPRKRWQVGSGSRFYHLILLRLVYLDTHSDMKTTFLLKQQEEEDDYRAFPLVHIGSAATPAATAAATTTTGATSTTGVVPSSSSSKGVGVVAGGISREPVMNPAAERKAAEARAAMEAEANAVDDDVAEEVLTNRGGRGGGATLLSTRRKQQEQDSKIKRDGGGVGIAAEASSPAYDSENGITSVQLIDATTLLPNGDGGHSHLDNDGSPRPPRPLRSGGSPRSEIGPEAERIALQRWGSGCEECDEDGNYSPTSVIGRRRRGGASTATTAASPDCAIRWESGGGGEEEVSHIIDGDTDPRALLLGSESAPRLLSSPSAALVSAVDAAALAASPSEATKEEEEEERERDRRQHEGRYEDARSKLRKQSSAVLGNAFLSPPAILSLNGTAAATTHALVGARGGDADNIIMGEENNKTRLAINGTRSNNTAAASAARGVGGGGAAAPAQKGGGAFITRGFYPEAFFGEYKDSDSDIELDEGLLRSGTSPGEEERAADTDTDKGGGARAGKIGCDDERYLSELTSPNVTNNPRRVGSGNQQARGEGRGSGAAALLAREAAKAMQKGGGARDNNNNANTNTTTSAPSPRGGGTLASASRPNTSYGRLVDASAKLARRPTTGARAGHEGGGGGGEHVGMTSKGKGIVFPLLPFFSSSKEAFSPRGDPDDTSPSSYPSPQTSKNNRTTNATRSKLTMGDVFALLKVESGGMGGGADGRRDNAYATTGLASPSRVHQSSDDVPALPVIDEAIFLLGGMRQRILEKAHTVAKNNTAAGPPPLVLSGGGGGSPPEDDANTNTNTTANTNKGAGGALRRPRSNNGNDIPSVPEDESVGVGNPLHASAGSSYPTTATTDARTGSRGDGGGVVRRRVPSSSSAQSERGRRIGTETPGEGWSRPGTQQQRVGTGASRGASRAGIGSRSRQPRLSMEIVTKINNTFGLIQSSSSSSSSSSSTDGSSSSPRSRFHTETKGREKPQTPGSRGGARGILGYDRRPPTSESGQSDTGKSSRSAGTTARSAKTNHSNANSPNILTGKSRTTTNDIESANGKERHARRREKEKDRQEEELTNSPGGGGGRGNRRRVSPSALSKSSDDNNMNDDGRSNASRATSRQSAQKSKRKKKEGDAEAMDRSATSVSSSFLPLMPVSGDGQKTITTTIITNKNSHTHLQASNSGSTPTTQQHHQHEGRPPAPSSKEKELNASCSVGIGFVQRTASARSRGTSAGRGHERHISSEGGEIGRGGGGGGRATAHRASPSFLESPTEARSNAASRQQGGGGRSLSPGGARIVTGATPDSPANGSVSLLGEGTAGVLSRGLVGSGGKQRGASAGRQSAASSSVGETSTKGSKKKSGSAGHMGSSSSSSPRGENINLNSMKMNASSASGGGYALPQQRNVISAPSSSLLLLGGTDKGGAGQHGGGMGGHHTSRSVSPSSVSNNRQHTPHRQQPTSNDIHTFDDDDTARVPGVVVVGGGFVLGGDGPQSAKKQNGEIHNNNNNNNGDGGGGSGGSSSALITVNGNLKMRRIIEEYNRAVSISMMTKEQTIRLHHGAKIRFVQEAKHIGVRVSITANDSILQLYTIYQGITAEGDSVLGNVEMLECFINTLVSLDAGLNFINSGKLEECVERGWSQYLDVVLKAPSCQTFLTVPIITQLLTKTTQLLSPIWRVGVFMTLLRASEHVTVCMKHADELSAAWQTALERTIASGNTPLDYLSLSQEDAKRRAALIQYVVEGQHPFITFDFFTKEGKDKQTIFSRACREGDVPLVRALLTYNTSCTNRQLSKSSPAAANGHLSLTGTESSMSPHNTSDIFVLPDMHGDQQTGAGGGGGALSVTSRRRSSGLGGGRLPVTVEKEINRVQSDGTNGLQQAAARNHADVVLFLLSQPSIGPSLSHVYPNKGNAYQIAVNLKRSEPIIRALKMKMDEIAGGEGGGGSAFPRAERERERQQQQQTSQGGISDIANTVNTNKDDVKAPSPSRPSITAVVGGHNDTADHKTIAQSRQGASQAPSSSSPSTAHTNAHTAARSLSVGGGAAVRTTSVASSAVSSVGTTASTARALSITVPQQQSNVSNSGVAAGVRLSIAGSSTGRELLPTGAAGATKRSGSNNNSGAHNPAPPTALSSQMAEALAKRKEQVVDGTTLLRISMAQLRSLYERLRNLEGVHTTSTHAAAGGVGSASANPPLSSTTFANANVTRTSSGISRGGGGGATADVIQEMGEMRQALLSAKTSLTTKMGRLGGGSGGGGADINIGAEDVRQSIVVVINQLVRDSDEVEGNVPLLAALFKQLTFCWDLRQLALSEGWVTLAASKGNARYFALFLGQKGMASVIAKSGPEAVVRIVEAAVNGFCNIVGRIDVLRAKLLNKQHESVDAEKNGLYGAIWGRRRSRSRSVSQATNTAANGESEGGLNNTTNDNNNNTVARRRQASFSRASSVSSVGGGGDGARSHQLASVSSVASGGRVGGYGQGQGQGLQRTVSSLQVALAKGPIKVCLLLLTHFRDTVGYRRFVKNERLVTAWQALAFLVFSPSVVGALARVGLDEAMSDVSYASDPSSPNIVFTATNYAATNSQQQQGGKGFNFPSSVGPGDTTSGKTFSFTAPDLCSCLMAEAKARHIILNIATAEDPITHHTILSRAAGAGDVGLLTYLLDKGLELMFLVIQLERRKIQLRVAEPSSTTSGSGTAPTTTKLSSPSSPFDFVSSGGLTLLAAAVVGDEVSSHRARRRLDRVARRKADQKSKQNNKRKEAAGPPSASSSSTKGDRNAISNFDVDSNSDGADDDDGSQSSDDDNIGASGPHHVDSREEARITLTISVILEGSKAKQTVLLPAPRPTNQSQSQSSSQYQPPHGAVELVPTTIGPFGVNVDLNVPLFDNQTVLQIAEGLALEEVSRLLAMS